MRNERFARLIASIGFAGVLLDDARARFLLDAKKKWRTGLAKRQRVLDDNISDHWCVTGYTSAYLALSNHNLKSGFPRSQNNGFPARFTEFGSCAILFSGRGQFIDICGIMLVA